jgi:hypothetical protein
VPMEIAAAQRAEARDHLHPSYTAEYSALWRRAQPVLREADALRPRMAAAARVAITEMGGLREGQQIVVPPAASGRIQAAMNRFQEAWGCDPSEEPQLPAYAPPLPARQPPAYSPEETQRDRLPPPVRGMAKRASLPPPVRGQPEMRQATSPGVTSVPPPLPAREATSPQASPVAGRWPGPKSAPALPARRASVDPIPSRAPPLPPRLDLSAEQPPLPPRPGDPKSPPPPLPPRMNGVSPKSGFRGQPSPPPRPAPPNGAVSPKSGFRGPPPPPFPSGTKLVTRSPAKSAETGAPARIEPGPVRSATGPPAADLDYWTCSDIDTSRY